MGETSIEWTEKTWNPVRGCSLASPGCTNCYAMRLAHRYAAPGKPFAGLTRGRPKGGPVWTGEVRFTEHMLDLPLSWREPQRVFVNSMSDLFHEDVRDEDIDRVFAVMALAERHTFQVLTKRSDRMRRYTNSDRRSEWASAAMPLIGAPRLGDDAQHEKIANGPRALPNVWLGASIEDQERADERLPELVETVAAIRFVSYEPALGPVDFGDALRFDPRKGVRGVRGIHWVIVGGESGPGARPFDVRWARSVVAQCKAAGVACFVKQIGALPWEVVPATGGIPTVYRDVHADRIWPAGTKVPGEIRDRFELRIPQPPIRHPKGGDWNEWPKDLDDLRVREWPEVRA